MELEKRERESNRSRILRIALQLQLALLVPEFAVDKPGAYKRKIAFLPWVFCPIDKPRGLSMENAFFA